MELVLPFQLYVGSGVSVRLSVSGGRCFYLLGHTDCSETSFSFIFFLDRLTIFLNLYMHVCVWVCTWECRNLQGPEDVVTPGAGVGQL